MSLRQSRYPALPPSLRWVVSNPGLAAVVISAVLLIYQACLPQGLTLDPSARTIEWRLLPSDEFDIARADIVGNVVPYWVFGHFVFAAVWRRRRRLGRALGITFIGTLSMAAAVETVQLFNVLRDTALWDLLSGAIGATIAMVASALYVRVASARVKAWLQPNAFRRPAGGAAAAVAAFVLVDAAKPFYVISSANLLWDNIKRSNLIPFRPRGADLRDQLQLTWGGHVPVPLPPAQWTLDYWASQAEVFLFYVCLLGLLAYRRPRRELGRILVVWGCVVVGAELVRLIIVGGAGDVTHLCVALIAAPLAVWAARRLERPPSAGLRALLLLSLSYVAVTDLRPFELGPAQAVSSAWFIPLIYQFRDIDVMQLWNVVEAAMVFIPIGAAAYALRLARPTTDRLDVWPSAWGAAALCGAVALGLESAQIWLPGRTPHIDDVLLALAGGVIGVSVVRLLVVVSAEAPGPPSPGVAFDRAPG